MRDRREVAVFSFASFKAVTFKNHPPPIHILTHPLLPLCSQGKHSRGDKHSAVRLMSQTSSSRVGAIALWLRALFAFTQDWSSVPSAHVVASFKLCQVYTSIQL